ncbi:hypothetical protein ACFUJR_03950 [Streptomyces sp. NPDC057271]|uniref:hypothetical protein n=1 Tax=Streptomyces sp. NPDC057271 TaxID=3346078 RepID=UPI0036413086
MGQGRDRRSDERREAPPSLGGDTPTQPAPEPSPVPPDDVPGLLALLGELLEKHAPEEVAVVLREELDRRETAAYASGWRDAAEAYAPALEEARRLGRRPLRLVGRTPGQAAVIPFPHERADAVASSPDDAPPTPRTGEESGSAPGPLASPPGPGPAPERGTDVRRPARAARPPAVGGGAGDVGGAGGAGAAAASDAPASGPVPGGPVPGDPGPAAPVPADPVPAVPSGAVPSGAVPSGAGPSGAVPGPRSASPADRPAFVRKNPKSKVPTIPRLPSPRGSGGRRKPAAGGAPEAVPEGVRGGALDGTSGGAGEEATPGGAV